MTNKQLAKIYRNAAKNLEDEGWEAYCCNAIEGETGNGPDNMFDACTAKDTLASVLGNPKNVYREDKEWGDQIDHGWFGPPTPKAQEARRIALCLAAAVVESGGL